MVVKVSPHADKNNFFGSAYGVSIESLPRTWSRFDFGIHWTGTEGAVTGFTSIGPSVHLLSDLAIVSDLPQGTSHVSVRWQASATSGEIKEYYYDEHSFGGSWPTALVTRDNVNPGWGAIRVQDNDSPDAGIPGPRYTFMLSGTEFRIYVDGMPFGNKPILIVPAPSTGFPFPLYLVINVPASFVVRNITASGNLDPSTIYSEREQIEDFGAAQTRLFLRIYQRSQYSAVDQGLPLDVLVYAPTLAQEDGDELVQEDNDTILR